MLCNNPDDELIIRLITNEPQAKTVTSVKIIQIPVWKLTGSVIWRLPDCVLGACTGRPFGSGSIKNSVGRGLSKIGLDDIGPEVSEFLADDFHSFLAGKPAGMEFIHPHLRIPMSQAVCTGGPSKVLDTGFGKDVGEALPGRDVVILLMIDAPVSKSDWFGQPPQFEFFGKLTWNNHLTHQAALSFHRIDNPAIARKTALSTISGVRLVRALNDV